MNSDDSGDGYIDTCHTNTPTPFLLQYHSGHKYKYKYGYKYINTSHKNTSTPFLFTNTNTKTKTNTLVSVTLISQLFFCSNTLDTDKNTNTTKTQVLELGP